MANYLITGKAFYAKIVGKPVPKYQPEDGNEWAFDLAVDANGVAQLKKLGLADKIKTKNDERGNYIQFRRGEYKGDKITKNDPIPIVDHRNQAWDGKTLIGNGSTLNVRFSVYPGRKGNKAFVTAVQVWDHVEYVPKAPFQARMDTSTADPSQYVSQMVTTTKPDFQSRVESTPNEAPFELDQDNETA